MAMLLWSCGGGNSTNQSNEGGKKVFRYNQTGGLTSLDPAYANIRANVWATSQIYNGLFSFSKTLDPHNELVQEWEVSEDGRVYTFTLKPDIHFHDNPCFKGSRGREMMAEDVVYSFRRIMKEGTGAWVFSDKVITNADGTPSDTCFKVLDNYRFRVYLKKRFSAFLHILATPYCYIVPKEAVEKYGKDFGKNPVGTGAFIFKKWDFGQKLVLVKNEHYWEKDNKHQPIPYIDAVEISFHDDRNTEFLEFSNGNLHFLCNLAETSRDQILEKNGQIKEKFANKFAVQKIPYLNTEYVGFYLEGDEKTNPLTNLKVRQALSYAVNRKELVSFRRNGLGMAADYGFVPFALPSFDSTRIKGYPYNPKKAQELLKEAGFPEGKGLPALKLYTYPSDKEIAEQLQKDWEDIGLKVNVEMNQFAAHRKLVGDGEAKMFRGSWIADYPDAENYLTLGYSKNFSPKGPNFFHFKNADFDKLYEEAHESDNLFTRYDDYLKMDQIFMDNAVMLPLYYDEVLHLKQPFVTGLEINAMNNLMLKFVDFKSKDGK
ncbi:MAG: ABC transporter substrate-binding protein [Bacteroidetes bacterium]|nr:MAG: ABC transporter substrate-binding protein [Bacteroidota bacterium]